MRVPPTQLADLKKRSFLALMVLLWPLFVSAQSNWGGDVVDVYQKLTGKTVLRPSNLYFDASILAGLPADKTNAASMIESNFVARGYTVVQDGPHFVWIYNKMDTSFEGLPLRGAELLEAEKAGQSKNAKISSGGSMNFGQAALDQVLAIYASLSQRTVLRPTSLAMANLSLKTAGPLTREEAVYALETVVAMNGVAMVQDGDQFVQAVPFYNRQKVAARAPKRDPSAALLDPNKLPAVGPPSAQKAPKTEVDRDLEKLRTAFYEFINYSDPPVGSAARLSHFYARLADKSATTSTNLASTMINLRVTQPMTKSELLYAVETTFSLNGMTVVTNDDGTLGLRMPTAVRRPRKKSEMNGRDASKKEDGEKPAASQH
jgi:hypothetical protein